VDVAPDLLVRDREGRPVLLQPDDLDLADVLITADAFYLLA
jgi:hypothetical protein